MAALSLHRNQTALGFEFRRRKSQLGPAGAITALAHKLARIVWHLVTYKVPYDETIFSKASEKHKKRQTKYLIKRIESMGYRVLPEPSVPA